MVALVGVLSDFNLAGAIAPSRRKMPVAESKLERDENMLSLLGSGQHAFDENNELCILQGRLHLASLSSSPTPQSNKYYLTLSKKNGYVAFCADFGPFNLG